MHFSDAVLICLAMIDIKVDKESGTPLYIQIRDALQKAVDSGKLKPGDRLPTVAGFSKSIGVTASTVRRAFEDLSKQGVAECHVGRGTFISLPAEGEAPAAPKAPLKEAAARETAPGTGRSAPYTPPAGLSALMRLLKRPDLIQLTHGDIEPLPLGEDAFEKLAKAAFRAGQRKYQVGDDRGLPELREILSARFSKEGTEIAPDQILITNGSQQALFLMAHLAAKEKKRVLCETPLLWGVINAFNAFDNPMEFVPRDGWGPDPSELARYSDGIPSMIYLCPVFNNPMGTSMSRERYDFVKEWAQRENALVVSDEIYRDLSFDDAWRPGFLPEVGTGNFVVTGSLSKTFAHGMRLGWLVAKRELICKLAPLKQANDMGSPYFTQGIADELFRSGEYDAGIVRLKKHFRDMRDSVINALADHMPDGVRWTIPRGGVHIWVELPEGYSSIEMFLLAVDRGVAVIPAPFLDTTGRYQNAFRISYGIITKEEIEKGIRLLADAVRELLREVPGAAAQGCLGDFR